MKKKIALGVLVVSTVLIVLYLDLLKYGVMQANGQLKVVWNAKPIGDVLSDVNFPDSLKMKIELMQEIRQFAIDSLGLKDTKNFTSVFDQKGEDILWNLSACEPYELKSVQWTFPFLGSFSYKGFFELDKAREERAELEKKGLDTRIRTVNAWSTLGWFRDPILSNQLTRSEGSLAELVIHELTHATVFIKDSLSYNENLASFIGEKGAVKFLNFKYGASSAYANQYVNSEHDYVKYTNHMLVGTKKLDSLYQSFTADMNDSLKSRKKQMMISKIIQAVDTVSFKNPQRFKGIFSERLPNNCYFLSFHRYFSKIDQFEIQLKNQFDGDLRAFIQYQKENQ
ncbi:aminopeptidase [Reichenbachiella sp. MALMAid0571]|uniref:aminopeptidase n=1 Tax=Reichenbachiella sp. MALMAid0571 TaxID=3143939 RepID=UPI0032DE7A61